MLHSGKEATDIPLQQQDWKDEESDCSISSSQWNHRGEERASICLATKRIFLALSMMQQQQLQQNKKDFLTMQNQNP
jgi:hypothetical protein